jgi:hypothetical protein
MKSLLLLAVVPCFLVSCATYNGREFAEVYNVDYRPFVEQPFDDMVDGANDPTVEGFGLDGKDAVKAVGQTRSSKESSNSIQGNGINITLQ